MTFYSFTIQSYTSCVFIIFNCKAFYYSENSSKWNFLIFSNLFLYRKAIVYCML